MSVTQTFWNQKADEWELHAGGPETYYTRRTRLTAELVARHLRGGRALDVGCGLGLLSYELALRGFDVYGTDLSERMLDKAVKRLSAFVGDAPARFRPSVKGREPFAFKFDLITAIGVFPYVENYGDYLDFLTRQLNPNGYVAASCTNRASFYNLCLLLQHLGRYRGQEGWRDIFVNLLRTGVWSGGYVDYHEASQCYDSGSFDKVFAARGFRLVESLDLHSIGALDSSPWKRGRVERWVACNFGWNHIGLYQRT